MKTLYGDRSKSVAEERRNASRLLTEVENLSLRLFYMESAKNDVRGDIAVMKRAAEKTENAAARTELDKQKQVIREYGSTGVRGTGVRGTGVRGTGVRGTGVRGTGVRRTWYGSTGVRGTGVCRTWYGSTWYGSMSYVVREYVVRAASSPRRGTWNGRGDRPECEFVCSGVEYDGVGYTIDK